MTADQPEPAQQQDVDVRNNPESSAYAAESTQRVARASDGGAPPREAPAAGELPEDGTEGTASGNPVAGLEMDPGQRDDAELADESAMEVDGPATGHS